VAKDMIIIAKSTVIRDEKTAANITAIFFHKRCIYYD